MNLLKNYLGIRFFLPVNNIKRIILINSGLNPQERKIAIAREIITQYYQAPIPKTGIFKYFTSPIKNNTNDILVRCLLMPTYIMKNFIDEGLSKEEILTKFGFPDNEFMLEGIDEQNQVRKLNKIMQKSYKGSLSEVINFFINIYIHGYYFFNKAKIKSKRIKLFRLMLEDKSLNKVN